MGDGGDRSVEEMGEESDVFVGMGIGSAGWETFGEGYGLWIGPRLKKGSWASTAWEEEEDGLH